MRLQSRYQGGLQSSEALTEARTSVSKLTHVALSRRFQFLSIRASLCVLIWCPYRMVAGLKRQAFLGMGPQKPYHF